MFKWKMLEFCVVMVTVFSNHIVLYNVVRASVSVIQFNATFISAFLGPRIIEETKYPVFTNAANGSKVRYNP